MTNDKKSSGRRAVQEKITGKKIVYDVRVGAPKELTATTKKRIN